MIRVLVRVRISDRMRVIGSVTVTVRVMVSKVLGIRVSLGPGLGRFRVILDIWL